MLYEVNLVAYTKGTYGQPQNEMQIYVDAKGRNQNEAIDTAIAQIKSVMKDGVFVECNGVREHA